MVLDAETFVGASIYNCYVLGVRFLGVWIYYDLIEWILVFVSLMTIRLLCGVCVLVLNLVWIVLLIYSRASFWYLMMYKPQIASLLNSEPFHGMWFYPCTHMYVCVETMFYVVCIYSNIVFFLYHQYFIVHLSSLFLWWLLDVTLGLGFLNRGTRPVFLIIYYMDFNQIQNLGRAAKPPAKKSKHSQAFLNWILDRSW